MKMRASHRWNVPAASRAGRALPARVCLALWLALMLGGCTSHAKKKTSGHNCYDCVICPTGVCGGYYPTCWRMWPAECPQCPVLPSSVMPTIVPTPAPPPTEIDGELIVPPVEAKARRPAQTSSRNRRFASHRRQQVVTSTLQRGASETSRRSAPPGIPDSATSHRGLEIPGESRATNGDGNRVMVLPATAPAQNGPGAEEPPPGLSKLSLRQHAEPAAAPEHPAVAWVFSSLGEPTAAQVPPPATRPDKLNDPTRGSSQNLSDLPRR